MQNQYSVENISAKLLEDIKGALASVKPYGSVELFVQNGSVTQITVRSIKKTRSKDNNKKSR